MGSEIITEIVVGMTSVSLLAYINSVKKGIKGLSFKVDELVKRVDNHTETIKDIALFNSAMIRIEQRIKQSFEFIDKDDKVIQSFISMQGIIAKECIEWAIHTNLKVTEKEIIGKFELCASDIRNYLLDTEPEYDEILRPQLRKIYQDHVRRVIEIASDSFTNAKLERFFTLTEQSINDILTLIIRTRISYLSTHEVKNNLSKE